ncbi:sodium-dependent lysophosphatidylcholine symporter 1-B-like [Girardinichthys multiradiatus]|uniref:sodium-dependent lysophosphatidylcholine symporter 1-B-like n=1 Tax=Girardinichthys multiradiatus TaxID=208333 RepID=UPI001FAD2730|nr:sodium-dependent lysophosphatidylcholine symporter 1-B-like [Girardinichthys multiradiatus]
MLISHIPYQRLVLGFVFSVLAFQMSLGNFALFCRHVAGLGAHFQLLLLILLLFIPAVITVACVLSNLPVFMTMCILMGFSVVTMFLLPCEKASSSSSDQREHSELPTTSQRFHVDDPKPNKSYKCDPSPCCQRLGKQCSVKSSTSSTVSSNPYGKNSRKTSHVQLQVNNQWQKPIVHPDQCPEESKLSESFPGNAPVSFCGRSQV